MTTPPDPPAVARCSSPLIFYWRWPSLNASRVQKVAVCRSHVTDAGRKRFCWRLSPLIITSHHLLEELLAAAVGSALHRPRLSPPLAEGVHAPGLVPFPRSVVQRWEVTMCKCFVAVLIYLKQKTFYTFTAYICTQIQVLSTKVGKTNRLLAFEFKIYKFCIKKLTFYLI